ncbi:M20 family metallopeptidase [Actinomycetota bacterium]
MDKKKKIIDFIDSKHDEILDFSLDLIKTLSQNPPGDESVVAKKIMRKASEWGFPDPEILEKKKNRPNLIYDIWVSKAGKRLAFNAHTDTKPIGDIDKWDIDPLNPEIIDGRLYGRGSTDMKGAIASIMAAAYSILTANIDLNGTLTLIFSADEEAGSAFGAKILVEHGFEADAIVIAEPSGNKNDFDSLSLVCRGALLGKVKVYGTQLHSSISDRPGCINAGVKMAKVLLAFHKELKQKLTYKDHYLYPNGPTVNPGLVVEGGIFYGVIPPEASFSFDIRTIPGMDNKTLISDIKGFLDDMMVKDKDLKAELIIEKPPLDNLLPAEIDRNHPIVKASIKATERVIGQKPRLIGVPFSTDAIYLANQLNISTIPSFGPGLISLAHKENEYINTKAIIDGAKIFALTALDFL